MKCALLLVFVHLCSTGGQVLPEQLSRLVCRRSDPEFDRCVADNVQGVFGLLVDGVPEIGLDPLDPVWLPQFEVEGDLTVVSIRMQMTNTTVVGGRGTKFHSYKFNPKSLKGKISGVIPFARMTTEYKANGHLFVVPLKSHALFDGNFTNFHATMSFGLKEVPRDGTKYFSIDSLKFTSRIESARLKLTPLDNFPAGVKLLENFVNNNNRLVLDAVNPLFNRYCAEFYKKALEKSLRLVPAHEILPE